MTVEDRADLLRRAEPVPLAPDAVTSDVFRGVVAECRAQWQTNEELLLGSRSVEALHQTRVGLRRLRSALSLFRPWAGGVAGYDDVAAALRAHTVPLGPARDLDVLLSGPLVTDLSADQLASLKDARETAYDVVLADLASPAWAGVVTALESLVDRVGSVDEDPPGVVTAGAALDRRWERVVRRGSRLVELTPTERHGVRIEAKKLRYGAQFFAGLFPGPLPDGVLDPWPYAEVVAALQDALGLANDAAVATGLLASVGAPPPVTDGRALVEGAVTAWQAVAAAAPFWRAVA